MLQYNSLILEKFQIVEKTNENGITILKDNTNNYILIHQLEFNCNQAVKTFIEKLQIIKQIQNQYLLSLYSYQVQYHLNSDNYSSMCTVGCFYQYYEDNLANQIQRRSKDKSYMTESQIWGTIKSLITVLSLFQDMDIEYGCLSLSNIKISTQKKIKLLNPSMNIAKQIYRQNQYYSPEILQKYYGDFITVNIYKSDVFSLGICLLHLCLLQNCSDCFNYEEYRLEPVILRDKFNLLVGRYSTELLDFLYDMLQYNHNIRPDFKKLRTYFQNHQNINHFSDIIKKSQNICQNLQNDEQDVLGLTLCALEKSDRNNWDFTHYKTQSKLEKSLNGSIKNHCIRQLFKDDNVNVTFTQGKVYISKKMSNKPRNSKNKQNMDFLQLLKKQKYKSNN